MSDIKKEIVDLSSTLKTGMSVGDDGVIKTEAGLYEKTLPEGLDMDTVKKVYGHTEDLTAALTLATGDLGEEVLKKNKKLDSVSSELKIGKHAEINVGYLRSQQRPKSVQDRTMVTQYGVTTARVKTFAQKNRGELKKVRTMLSDRATGLFS